MSDTLTPDEVAAIRERWERKEQVHRGIEAHHPHLTKRPAPHDQLGRLLATLAERDAALAAVTRERDRLWKAADEMVSVLDDSLNQGEKFPHTSAFNATYECRLTTRTMTELAWQELGEYREDLRRALTTSADSHSGVATGGTT